MQVTVPQAHEPGADAEVDFGQLYAQVAGVLLKLWMFVMRLPRSDRAFHVAFATQAQKAYDNLKPARLSATTVARRLARHNQSHRLHSTLSCRTGS